MPGKCACAMRRQQGGVVALSPIEEPEGSNERDLSFSDSQHYLFNSRNCDD